MKPGLIIALLLSTSASALAQDKAPAEAGPTEPAPSGEEAGSSDEGSFEPDCTDVYDRSGPCVGLQLEPLEGVGEPISAEEPEEGNILDVLDEAWLGWGLFGAGAAAVAGAAAFHAAGFVYALQLERMAEGGQVGPEALPMTTAVQTGLGVGAGAMWITAALLGGTALALWTFDPETGAVTLPFFE